MPKKCSIKSVLSRLTCNEASSYIREMIADDFAIAKLGAIRARNFLEWM